MGKQSKDAIKLLSKDDDMDIRLEVIQSGIRTYERKLRKEEDGVEPVNKPKNYLAANYRRKCRRKKWKTTKEYFGGKRGGGGRNNNKEPTTEK